MIHDYL